MNFFLSERYKIYLFVSYPPCGSAAYLSDPLKRPKLEHKSLNHSDLYLKPGKGFQTTSLSCSNKINRWIAQGLQGSLLDQIIIKPIQLSGLIIHSTIDLSSIFANTSISLQQSSWTFIRTNEEISSSTITYAQGKQRSKNTLNQLTINYNQLIQLNHPIKSVQKLDLSFEKHSLEKKDILFISKMFSSIEHIQINPTNISNIKYLINFLSNLMTLIFRINEDNSKWERILRNQIDCQYEYRENFVQIWIDENRYSHRKFQF